MMELDTSPVRLTPSFWRPNTFTSGQWQELLQMREHYRRWGDDLSRNDLARLRFVRWLYQSGRVDP